MAISRPIRDKAYLLIIATQLFGMLAMDLVPFYPPSLYKPPSAPLHFLVTLRSTYITLTHDPFFSHASHEPWFQAFMYVELLAQFPLALFLVYKLGKGCRTAGTELAGLAFGCVTGMGSVTCCYVLAVAGEEVLAAEKKALLFWGEYLPFAVIPVIMALDMNQRLLARIYTAESRAKKQ